VCGKDRDRWGEINREWGGGEREREREREREKESV